jgi:hypothetical protein
MSLSLNGGWGLRDVKRRNLLVGWVWEIKEPLKKGWGNLALDKGFELFGHLFKRHNLRFFLRAQLDFGAVLL